MIFLAIVAFIFGLCLIIVVHELGHFIFAKKANILCYDYSIGMGPLLYGKKKGETLYGIRAIPLGGFVSMAGEQVTDELVKVDMVIGLNFDDGMIKEIIFGNAKEAEVTGTVVSRDLYGKDGDLYIELEVDGVVQRYEVLEKAFLIDCKKQMQLAPYWRCFESKTLWQRFITLFAGPAMNFVLAIILFLIVAFAVGQPQKTPQIGGIGESYTVLDKTYEAPAYAAGIRQGDVIVKINDTEINEWDSISGAFTDAIDDGKEEFEITYLKNGEAGTETTTTVRPIIYIGNLGVAGNFEVVDDGAQIYLYTTKAKNAGLEDGDIITKIDESTITSWSDLILFCNNVEDGKNVTVSVIRGDETKEISLDLLEKETIKGISDLEFLSAKIGIEPEYKFSFFGSFKEAFVSVGDSFSSVGNTLKLLFTSNDVGVSDLSGPVGIFGLIKNSLLGGFTNYLYFLGFLSVNIGIINLLPIPALDGGRIVFLGYELVTKKKVNRKVENTLNTIVFFLLIALFIFITFNDIGRLFG